MSQTAIDMVSKWALALISALVTAGVIGLWQSNERLTRVEERQKVVIENQISILNELRQHEQGTKH